MTLRIGLVAASRIAVDAVVEPAREIDGVEVTAVAARSVDRAAEVAERWGIPNWYGSYEEMLGSDAIDAAYVGTPAAFHREWSVAALDAGKHVLCEKPFAANAADARRLADAAHSSSLVVMEALHWRYHPLVAQMRSVLDSIGDVRHVEASFVVGSANIPRSDIRWDLSIGGGALMDIGVYPVAWVRWAMGAEPTVTSARAETPVPGVDGRVEADLAWGSGATGRIVASMIESEPGHRAHLVVEGSSATMRVVNPLAPQHGASLVVERGTSRQELPVSVDTTYSHQLQAFRNAVVDGAAFPTTADEGVRNMALIDAIYRAAGLDPRPARP